MIAHGNKIIASGHKEVAEGWKLFDAACSEAGPGDLPDLLRALKLQSPPAAAASKPSKRAMESTSKEETLEVRKHQLVK